MLAVSPGLEALPRAMGRPLRLLLAGQSEPRGLWRRRTFEAIAGRGRQAGANTASRVGDGSNLAFLRPGQVLVVVCPGIPSSTCA